MAERKAKRERIMKTMAERRKKRQQIMMNMRLREMMMGGRATSQAVGEEGGGMMMMGRGRRPKNPKGKINRDGPKKRSIVMRTTQRSPESGGMMMKVKCGTKGGPKCGTKGGKRGAGNRKQRMSLRMRIRKAVMSGNAMRANRLKRRRMRIQQRRRMMRGK